MTTIDELAKLAWHLIETIVGRRIKNVYLAVYIFQGEIKWNDIWLQFSFADGSTLFLDGDGDGQSLRASPLPWEDPFAGKLSQENIEYIKRYGNWELLDVANQEPLSLLIDKLVDEVKPLFDQFGVLNGVQILVSDQCLNFTVEFDEGHISWGSS